MACWSTGKLRTMSQASMSRESSSGARIRQMGGPVKPGMMWLDGGSRSEIFIPHETGANMSDKVYVYIGDGAGIAGLPNIVSEQEAKDAGVLDLLKDAIKAGKYIVKPDKPAKEGE